MDDFTMAILLTWQNQYIVTEILHNDWGRNKNISIFYFRHSTYNKSLSRSFFSSRVSGVIISWHGWGTKFSIYPTPHYQGRQGPIISPHDICNITLLWSHAWFTTLFIDLSPLSSFHSSSSPLTKLVIFDTYCQHWKLLLVASSHLILVSTSWEISSGINSPLHWQS